MNTDPLPGQRCKSAVKLQEICRLNLIKFQHVNEVISNQGNTTLLSEIYTELYITAGDGGKDNHEHEVGRIEAASRRTATAQTPIKCSEIFKSSPEEDKTIRSILTKGVAGIGKTVSVQKFIVDWAERKSNQDILLIFPFPFRELNLMKDQKLSLMEFLHRFLNEIKETNISRLDKVLLIFDGLDECRFPLDFQNTARVSDVTEPAPVHVLLINLIKGNLLPSALIWITSRPAAADQIPSEYVDRFTEVRGFNDPQKEEYFRKRISDPNLANDIITHLKSLRSLYIMCYIPVFCWISSTVLERMLGEAEGGEIPKTLTQMYTRFLVIQTKIIKEKYPQKQVSHEEMLLKLGKLAFRQLMKGNLIFYQDDVMECHIDVTEASLYSGVCTQIFREESELHHYKVYSFVHLSIQEHLAALYVHLNFINTKKNVLLQNRFYNILMPCKKPKVSDVHKSAVDQTLQSVNGRLDLFLRFLLGLSVESNQELLQTIVTQTGSSSHSTQETAAYIKKKIREDLTAEKSINLFHCLNELEDHSLTEEIQQYLQSGNVQKHQLSSSQWSAVVFVLLTSAQEHHVFQLHKYTNKHCRSEEVLHKLLPVIAASRNAECSNCDLKVKACADLASVISSESSCLRELDLSGNRFNDKGVKILSDALKISQCKLESLRLCNCNISDEGCVALTSALISNPSHLKELDLSRNYFTDSGVQRLSDLLGNPQCKLEILRLYDCISNKGCVNLMRALRSNPSHLRELVLSKNKLESEVEDLSELLMNPQCKLEILKLCYCEITNERCCALTSALRSNPSNVKELDLTENKLHDSGAKSLSDVLKNPQCKLETLKLRKCDLTDEGCVALTSAVTSNPSHLMDLDLSDNNLKDPTVTRLSSVLKNPQCKLEILKLCRFYMLDEGCDALAKALRSNPSHLRELDLSGNTFGDSGVKRLCPFLENPHCKLEILRLCGCGVSNDGCVALASALRSNPSHLTELELTGNDLQDSGVKRLCAKAENLHCKLEILRLRNCGVSDQGCAALAAALKSKLSNLRELELNENNLQSSGVKSLCDGLANPYCKLEILRLCNCGVSEEGCGAALASALKSNPSHLRELELAGNDLRDSDKKLLSSLQYDKSCKLHILKL